MIVAELPRPEPRPWPEMLDLEEEVSKVRKLDCRNYEDCLNTAIKADWSGFTCAGCPAHDPKSKTELLDEATSHMAAIDRNRGEKD